MQDLRLSNPVLDETYSLEDMCNAANEIFRRLRAGVEVTPEQREWLDWAEQQLQDWHEDSQG